MSQLVRGGDWMQTFTGRAVDPFKMTADDVDIKDIAHALSNICRYGGHCDHFYSVAQHSVLVAMELAPEQDQLCALLHDASEAYIGDMIRPLKREFPIYKGLENWVYNAIAHKFSLPYPIPQAVRDADEKLLARESRDLMGGERAGKWSLKYPPSGPRIEPMKSILSEAVFLRAFEKLSNGQRLI